MRGVIGGTVVLGLAAAVVWPGQELIQIISHAAAVAAGFGGGTSTQAHHLLRRGSSLVSFSFCHCKTATIGPSKMLVGGHQASRIWCH